MNFVQYMLSFLALYICVYALINRVCQCVEHCATARAYSKFREIRCTVGGYYVEA